MIVTFPPRLSLVIEEMCLAAVPTHMHCQRREKSLVLPYKKHFCLLSVFRKTQGVGDMVKQTQNTHSIQVYVQQHWLR